MWDAEAELIAALDIVLGEHRDACPSLRAATTTSVGGGGQALALALGIERILDGLEALIARRESARLNHITTGQGVK